MNRKRANLSVPGVLLFFATIALTVTVALLMYGLVDERTGGNKKIVAIVMLLVVVFLSILWTIADVIRRRIMVDKPVEQILSATERIAAGDFSVRLQQRHGYAEYDEYDCIMENLNLMAEALGKSEMLKTDFISNVSHELKTPLAVIKSYALLLQTEQDEGKRRESCFEFERSRHEYFAAEQARKRENQAAEGLLPFGRSGGKRRHRFGG